MTKFVLMFHGGETPEEASSEVMDRWMAWFGELGEAVVDMGAPFGSTATIASDGTPSPGSGPDPANGYTVIEAANLHNAVVIAKGCPGLSSGGFGKTLRGNADGVTADESLRSGEPDCARSSRSERAHESW